MTAIDFSELNKLSVMYKERYVDNFELQQKELFDEFTNKLEELGYLSNKIVQLTNRLTSDQAISFDQDNDTISFFGHKFKLKRADPNRPIQVDNITEAYPRNFRDPIPSEVNNKVGLKKELERTTTSFYQTAHRITHITNGLPRLEIFKSREIRIIRNKLIEHPEGKDSGVTHDSFAYSKNEGPFVKGLRLNNQAKYMDKGFYNNCVGFINKLEEAIRAAL